MPSYYEIGGVLMDGSYGYDHRRFTRLRRAIRQKQPLVVSDITTGLVFDFIKEHGEVSLEFERSERLKQLEAWGKRWRRRAKRFVSIPGLPLPMPAKVAISSLPELAVMYSKAVGSYDLRTLGVQRYEESVHWGGSGGMII